jgi:hypothetical protein
VTTLALFAQFLRRLLANLFRLPTCKRHFDYVLGFGSTTVTGLGRATVSVRPNVAFRPERLVVPSGIAGSFMVEGIEVGGVRQLASVGGVPAVVFTERSLDVCMRMDVARPGDFVSVTILNQDVNERVFQCAMFGPRV